MSLLVEVEIGLTDLPKIGGGLEPSACNIPADKKELPVKNKYAKCLKKVPNLKYCLNLSPKIYVSAMKNFISCTRPEHSAYVFTV